MHPFFVFYKGFHTDSAITKLIGSDKKKEEFLKNGQSSLKKAMAQALVGNTVGDISFAMYSELKKHNLNPVWALTGTLTVTVHSRFAGVPVFSPAAFLSSGLPISPPTVG